MDFDNAGVDLKSFVVLEEALAWLRSG